MRRADLHRHDQCPNCGYWLTDADHRGHDTGLFSSRRVRLVALVMLAAFAFALLAGILSIF